MGTNQPTTADLLNLLAQQVTTLTQQVARIAAAQAAPAPVPIAATTTPKRYVQKPSTYDGKRADEARRFLAAFRVWAQDQREGLSTPIQAPLLDSQGQQRRDAQGNPRTFTQYQPDVTRWVPAALTFLTDDAAIWATTVLESIGNGRMPYADWDAFVEAFRRRFETVDEEGDALVALDELWQGTKTVPEFVALFQQHAGRTRLSEQDKVFRFRKHLSSFVKDKLSETDRNVDTLENLIKVATDIDKRKRERDAERARERGKAASSSSHPYPRASTSAPAGPSGSAFQSRTDPNAMEIDATTGRTPDEWRKALAGKCFACGSKDHIIARCPYRRSICDHCRKVGHTAAVCRSRY